MQPSVHIKSNHQVLEATLFWSVPSGTASNYSSNGLPTKCPKYKMASNSAEIELHTKWPPSQNILGLQRPPKWYFDLWLPLKVKTIKSTRSAKLLLCAFSHRGHLCFSRYFKTAQVSRTVLRQSVLFVPRNHMWINNVYMFGNPRRILSTSHVLFCERKSKLISGRCFSSYGNMSAADGSNCNDIRFP